MVKGVVIGLPLNLDGSESPRSQSSRAFARNLADWELPILLWDERWSTQAVTRTLIEQDGSRAKRAELVDKMADAYILQGAIDALTTGSPAGFDPQKWYSWRVIQTDPTVAVSGLQTATVTASGFGTYLGQFMLTGDANGVYLNYSPVPVPEPAFLVAVGAAGLGLLSRVRRRTRDGTAIGSSP